MKGPVGRGGTPGRRPGGRSAPRWNDAAVGVDLGGTKIALGVVDRRGKILDAVRLPTRAQRPAREIIADIVTCVNDRWAGRLGRDRPLGIGVAGQVDAGGTVRFGPNLRWSNVPLRRDLARGLGRPVHVLNDVQAATVGEWVHGAGRGTSDLVCMFVGTGVGGGIVADGRLRHGASGTAGELGHLTIVRNGRRCRCPNSGCLEAYVGGWAIAERAQEAVRSRPSEGATLLRLAGELEAITSETVEQAYRAGDALAGELVDETMGYLASGLVSVVNGLDPTMLVLGGGVLEGFLSLVPQVSREVKARALPVPARALKVVPAKLGGESGVVGAGTYALRSEEAR